MVETRQDEHDSSKRSDRYDADQTGHNIDGQSVTPQADVLNVKPKPTAILLGGVILVQISTIESTVGKTAVMPYIRRKVVLI